MGNLKEISNGTSAAISKALKGSAFFDVIEDITEEYENSEEEAAKAAMETAMDDEIQQAALTEALKDAPDLDLSGGDWNLDLINIAMGDLAENGYDVVEKFSTAMQSKVADAYREAVSVEQEQQTIDRIKPGGTDQGAIIEIVCANLTKEDGKEIDEDTAREIAAQVYDEAFHKMLNGKDDKNFDPEGNLIFALEDAVGEVFKEEEINAALNDLLKQHDFQVITLKLQEGIGGLSAEEFLDIQRSSLFNAIERVAQESEHYKIEWSQRDLDGHQGTVELIRDIAITQPTLIQEQYRAWLREEIDHLKESAKKQTTALL